VFRIKDTGKSKLRWSKVPRMAYPCVYIAMKTMNGDANNSNCKDYKAQGFVRMELTCIGNNVPDCLTYSCYCTVDVFFFEKDF
jgi:hypothetical protein